MMDFAGLTNLGWRGALIAVIALLAIYVAIAFWRMRRLKLTKEQVNAPDLKAALSAAAAYAAVQNPDAPKSSSSFSAQSEPELLSAPSEFAFPWNEPPPGEPGQRMFETLEREINQLRKEVGGLRAEVLILREELRREPVQAPVMPPSVSPLYSDAMQMAMQGHDAATISQHCGISRAESELVVALVRNRD